jgi:hypothetical protein
MTFDALIGLKDQAEWSQLLVKVGKTFTLLWSPMDFREDTISYF